MHCSEKGKAVRPQLQNWEDKYAGRRGVVQEGRVHGKTQMPAQSCGNRTNSDRKGVLGNVQKEKGQDYMKQEPTTAAA